MTDAKKDYVVRLGSDLGAKLKPLADKRFISINSLVRVAMSEWLEKHKLKTE